MTLRQTSDGKYYMYGYYNTGYSKQTYDIGINTEYGSECIDTVTGYRKAVKRFKEIVQEREGANV